VFYFKRNIDEANTGLPMGYLTGVVDKFNPAPEGSIEVDSQSAIDQLIIDSEKGRNCVGCNTLPIPIDAAKGLRWHESKVGFHFSNRLPGEDAKWLMEEYEILREFVETNTPLKLFVSRFARGAQIKNITIDELDGPGGTLGETRYRFIEAENRMIEATVVCDIADQGPSKRPTKKHEFGHCFGIPHHLNPDALMYFALNTATDYGPHILEEFQMRHPMIIT